MKMVYLKNYGILRYNKKVYFNIAGGFDKFKKQVEDFFPYSR